MTAIVLVTCQHGADYPEDSEEVYPDGDGWRCADWALCTEIDIDFALPLSSDRGDTK